MVHDINPFSIDSFAEHTRAGHGQWMAIDNWLALKSPGKNQAKHRSSTQARLEDAMPTEPPGKAIMICKKVLWLKSKECWVAKWQFIRLRSVSSMTCKHEMRTQRFPLDEVNSNFQVPHVHYPSISDRLVPMLRCSSLLFWWVYSRARDKIPV